MSSLIRTKVLRKFRMRGYTLKPEALPEIIGFIRLFPEDEDEALDLLLDKLHYTSLKSSILDKEPVQRVVTELLENRTTNKAAYLKIINAFDFPKLQYDPIKKLFHKHPGNLPIHGDAESKVALYRDRFRLLLQRISRNGYFSRPVFDSDISGSGSYQVSRIQSLVGQTGKKCVMGLISQLDGHFILEDMTAAVEIDLSSAKVATGFIAENTIVLAEGEMLVDGIFKVTSCGFPPLEDRETAHSVFAGTDFFGGGLLTKEETIRLEELERGAVNDMFVILSDVWLDNENRRLWKTLLPSSVAMRMKMWSRLCLFSWETFGLIHALLTQESDHSLGS